ncbi:MAG: hypothetical protein CME24_21930 [Gemmatimonadetes bacterium]|nr:hypothetical protein [Gemmatimonadota bacterium]
MRRRMSTTPWRGVAWRGVAWRAREFPDLRIVLDHCGYVSPNLYPPEPTVDAVVRLADLPNVYTKLSFLGAAIAGGFPCADVHWMVRRVVDAFGAERCVFGTNSPTAQKLWTWS